MNSPGGSSSDKAHMAAGMLVVGFKKGWHLNTLLEAIGESPVHSKERANQVHEQFPFLPGDLWRYGKHAGDVRKMVHAEFPKLAAFLNANYDKPERLVAVASQIVRLTAQGRHVDMLRKQDKAEGRATRRAARVVESSNAAARKQQLSTQRGAWNVCKG